MPKICDKDEFLAVRAKVAAEYDAKKKKILGRELKTLGPVIDAVLQMNTQQRMKTMIALRQLDLWLGANRLENRTYRQILCDKAGGGK